MRGYNNKDLREVERFSPIVMWMRSLSVWEGVKINHRMKGDSMGNEWESFLSEGEESRELKRMSLSNGMANRRSRDDKSPQGNKSEPVKSLRCAYSRPKIKLIDHSYNLN